MIGNGGYAGEDLESVSRQRSRDGAVAAGFVFTQTTPVMTRHSNRSGPSP
jgi:hypothetical protein